MLSAMLYVLRTGVPWRDLPDFYGPWASVYTRYRRWVAGGLFARLLAGLAQDAVGELRHLDCSFIKLHQHGANPPGGQQAQAMGRTKGGLNTKLAAVVDARGRAVAVSLAPGPQHDQHAVAPLLPCVRRRRVVADKGFDADTFRGRLHAQRTRCCIPPKRGRRQPARFHRGYYRRRHQIENFFCRIKAYRRVATRYDKLAVTFLGFIQLAAIVDWLSHRF
jgi:transposase